MKYQFENFIIENTTGEEFFILGIPLNCKIWGTDQPCYLIADKGGRTYAVAQETIESDQFKKKP